MKKIFLLLLLILVAGCGVKEQEPQKEKEEIVEEEKEKEPIYQDENPLKIGLYQNSGNLYKKVDEFISPLEDYKDIGTFSIILSNDEEVTGSSIKELYNNVKSTYDDFSKYKIGYNISFKVQDGTTYNETILKPLDLFDYPFQKYLYIWLYDDINTTGWHSHIEKNEYTDTTVMSSIKLMSTENSRDVVDGFKITVFTYDTMDDFDEEGNYRGLSSHTLTIKYGGEK